MLCQREKTKLNKIALSLELLDSKTRLILPMESKKITTCHSYLKAARDLFKEATKNGNSNDSKIRETSALGKTD